MPGPCSPVFITRGEKAETCINHSNVRKILINAVTVINKIFEMREEEQSILPLDLYTQTLL